jgi:signal transduction histidine kinase
LKRETVLGRTDFELFPEDIAQQFRTNDVNAMGAGRMTESQERLDTPLGEQVFLSRKVPLTSSSDEVEGICGISTNITDRRRAELALQEANIMLQQRTNELAKSLEDLHAAQDRLVQTEKFAALGRLVAGVAHEINTPLGNSLTVASTFLNKTNQFEADAASGNVRRSTLNEYLSTSREAASQIMGNLKQAVDLIQSFKQLDADSNFSDRRGFDLGQMTEQIVRSLRSGLRSHDLAFSVDCEPNLVMNSYPGPYGQVLTNLVLNSAAHAFPGHSRGSVRITTREFDKDNVEISVSDDGCGMTPEIQRQAFDPFFTTRRDQGKVGLGLHIVYNLVTNRLGGRIDLDTRPGEGTRILMIVPREAPSEIAAE